jgi:hypothetical protein
MAAVASALLIAIACGDNRQLVAEPDAAKPDAMVYAPKRVLFIGNSYTFVNDLPQIIKLLSATTAQPIEPDVVVVGGATLWQHYQAGTAQAKLRSGQFDLVVLQGQSLETLDEGHESFLIAGQMLADVARQYGVKTVWFATWARAPGNAPWDSESSADMIEQTYATLARNNGGSMARVGAAFYRARKELPDVALISDDGSHPTPAGSVLAGCILNTAITGQPAAPATGIAGVDYVMARRLCSFAKEIPCLLQKQSCDGYCVDESVDRLNCGTCGTTCDAGIPCTEGVCGCQGDLSACNLNCFDLSSNDFHCGACDNVCGDGTGCKGSQCVCEKTAVINVFDGVGPRLPDLFPDCHFIETEQCKAAGRQYCEQSDCFNAGFGPPAGHSPQFGEVTCFANAHVVDIEYTALTVINANCDVATDVGKAACANAVHRYCVAQGFAAGFGDEFAGVTAHVSCLDSSDVTMVATDIITLRLHASRCEPDAISCGSAAWSLCNNLGFRSGFGPVAQNAEQRSVVCVR